MKRVFLPIIVLLLLYNYTYSQISLSLNDCPLPKDTVKYNNSSLNSTTFNLTGDNIVWDFSNMIITGSSWKFYSNNDDNSYPNDAVCVKSLTNFSLFNLASKYYYRNSDSGFKIIGSAIEPAKFSISQYTGTATDSITFPQSKNYFSDCPNLIYPLNSTSQWNYSVKYNTNFILSVALFALNNVPGNEVQTVTQNYSVVANGYALFKDGNGQNIQYNALLLKSDLTILDSFFLGGAPAPAALLSAFNLKQGNVSKFTNYYLQAKGSTEPIAILNTNTKDPSEITGISFLAFNATTSVKENANPYNISTYPNPLTNNNFNIKFNKTDNENWSLRLFNYYGEEVYTTNVISSSGETILNIFTPNLANGCYFWSIRNNKYSEIYKGSIVIQK